MADSTKVRLVRCPKCENLLPELVDYSVYQCGGCGAVLRAKNKNGDGDTLSEKSDEERAGRGTTVLQNSVEKEVVEVNDNTSDADVKSNASSLRSDDKNLEKDDVGSADETKTASKTSSGKWVVENGLEMNVGRDDLCNSVGRERGDSNSLLENNAGTRRSDRMPGWRHGDRGEMEGFGKVMRTEVEGVRFSTSNGPDEGSSNCNLDSYSCSYGEPLRFHDDRDGANRVKALEKDRAELLRKLDELKEQLSRSCDVADKPKDKVPLNGRAPSDPYVGSDTWVPGSSSMSDRASTQFLPSDKHAAGPSYSDHRPEPFPYNNRHEMAMHGFHPAMHRSNNISGYGDPFGSQMLSRVSHQFPSQFPQPPRQYFSGRYFDTSPDPFEPYPSTTAFHQSSCSCVHCYEKHYGSSAAVPPAAFYNKRFPDVLHNPMLYPHENPGAFGQHATNSRNFVPPPMTFHAPPSHTRWPSDLNNDMGSYGRSRPRKMVIASSGRCCRPIAGGAPFFTCFNCFELLKLPKKALLMAKNQQKMRCGACSTVITFSVANKKLLLSASTESRRIPTEVDDSSNEMSRGNTSYSHGHMNHISENFSSDDYDDSDYDFQAIDADPIVSSAGQGLNSTNPQEMQSFDSASRSLSEEEDSPEVLVAPREVISLVQQPIKAALSPPPDGSPLEENFNFSSTNHAVSRFGKGNRSSRSDQEKIITKKATTRQNSMKEASLATEMDVSFQEYSNIDTSHDSGDARRADSQSKTNKGGESFFTNIIKKSFKDFARSNQTDERGKKNGKNNVSVNGRLLPDRVIKKAERQAGPIHPGQYWYDFRAGFWGVMGGPCLGIIPPFIEELNHPMPENCAGGTTGVFVNGRELHQKDLELLASRGLPTERDRSYIIEISGRVVDEDTGEELESLGKLAPTIERVRHGFGMKAPKAAA